MARFTAIDGKEFKDLTFDEFKSFFVEHIFMKFMDLGRKGIEMAADDLVTNTVEFQLARKHVQSRARLTPEQHREAVLWVTKELMNSFIREGTQGLDAVVIHTSTYMANIRQ